MGRAVEKELFDDSCHCRPGDSANLDLSEGRRDAAVAKYEGAIQIAFREVADALAARETLLQEERARRALATTSTEALMPWKSCRSGRQGVLSHAVSVDVLYIFSVSIVAVATMSSG